MFIYYNITINDALGAMCKAVPHSRRKLLLEKCSFGQLREASQNGDLMCMLTNRLVVVINI